MTAGQLMGFNQRITQAGSSASSLRRMRAEMRALARRALPRVTPRYARRRASRAEAAAALGRLTAEVEHVRERHTERIDRLEDLTRELVLTAESLRRDIAERGRDDGR
jgi:hypothetical protein